MEGAVFELKPGNPVPYTIKPMAIEILVKIVLLAIE
ncbi:MAG: hypothetical protein ACI841_001773 [Planctomycetota bacterium]|jgi:hypothetical protein